MGNSSQYFLSLAFGLLVISGLAIGYFASNLLLTVVAYLSPWLPVWMWYIDIGLYGIAVSIAATSTVGVIASIANKGKALKLCWLLLAGLFMIEIGATILMASRKCSFDNSLSLELKESMETSQNYYSSNISDTQMWDEIQIEVNCCGVDSYKDWFSTSFGNKDSVPDSCCLLVSEGCGQNIASNTSPDDEIVTEGCLPTIMSSIRKQTIHFGYNIWLPVLGSQFVLIVVIMYFVHKASKMGRRAPNIFMSTSSGFGAFPKYQPLAKH